MKRFLFLLFIPFLFSFSPPGWQAKSEQAAYIHRAIKEVTDVMVHDIFSPPVASRIYAYITVAGYEAARPADGSYRTLAGQLHDLKTLPQQAAGAEYSFAVASVEAILKTGRALVVSEEKIDAFQKEILAELQASGMPADVFNRSIAYGDSMATAVLAWAATDNYKQTRSFPKYDVEDDAATWKPTPPAYIKAVEPHWSAMRPFLIDSAAQFKPLPPTPFSTKKESRFFKEAEEVRATGLKLSATQKEIANFWDCNPFKMNLNGHVMYATKKISPGGHWVNITRLACKKTNAGLVQSLEAYACLSVAMADCFISCWDEKYRSNVIRPETYINQYMDESWMPLLQTPPFPEYTSGHSVVSTASAVLLTKLFGDNFTFSDSTETEFGLPPRQFSSFKQAAAEAAISRLYGGIHYRPAIVNGIAEGKALGQFMVSHLRTRQ